MLLKRKTSPYWYVVISLPGGKKKWISSKTTNKSKALQIENQLKAGRQRIVEKQRYDKIFQDMAREITKQPVSEFGLPIELVWDKFLEDPKQSNRSAYTIKTKKWIWNTFAKWLGGNHSECKTIQDISRTIAYEYMLKFKDQSSSTFNNNKNSLSSIWQTLLIPEDLPENIWRLIPGAENNSEQYRPFSSNEMKLILKNASELWRGLSTVAYYTGLRKKDIALLGWDQIKNDHIELIPAKTKRKKKAVWIHLHPDLKVFLKGLKKVSNHVFPEAAKKYNTKEIIRGFSNLLKDIGICDNNEGKVGFHSLRTTFVTRAEEAGISREVVQGIVGHGSPKMTEHYSHDKVSGKAIEKLPSILD